MPGNAGGAKGPDFWCAFEDGEVVVIGDEPANTINDRRRRRLLCRGAKESYSPCRSRVRLVCLRVPCGEASRKAGDGKRGVGHRPQATAPILDSTYADFAHGLAANAL
jgi:hypothetical protein